MLARLATRAVARSFLDPRTILEPENAVRRVPPACETRVMRFLLALALLVAAAVCGVGILATFEPGNPSVLSWRIGYGMAAAICLYGAWQALRPDDDA